MTDLRARLADALANHQGICDGHTTTECWCGEGDSVRGNGIEWAEHAADVLLSLPGIAIVELPTPIRSVAEMRALAAALLAAANTADSK